MKKLIKLILVLAVVMPVLALSWDAQAQDETSILDGVKERGTIRCGYLPYEPFIIYDANTGALSGVVYDYINEAAAEAGYEVDWSTEINVDQVVPAVEAGRIDMLCLPITPDENWIKRFEFSGSTGALPYFVYTAADSTLTEEDLPAASFAVVDGYALTSITKTLYPDAEYVELMQMTSVAEMYDQLRFGKADAHVNEHISAANYERNNPGTIRRLSDEPIIAMRMFLGSKKGDEDMANFIQTHFNADAPENLPRMERLLEKYNVPREAMLLGDECANPQIYEAKQWRTCGIAVKDIGAQTDGRAE